MLELHHSKKYIVRAVRRFALNELRVQLQAKIEKKLSAIRATWSKMPVSFDCSNPDCPLLGELGTLACGDASASQCSHSAYPKRMS